MKKEIILKGTGFILRPYRKGDEVSLTKNVNNKKVIKNLGNHWHYPYTLKDGKRFVTERLRENKKEKFPIKFVIDVNGLAVGNMGARIGDHRQVTFGYFLGERFWNKGITTEAVKLFTRYLFKVHKAEKLIAHVFLRNTASKRILEKNGFTQEGLFRKAYFKDGKMIDEYYYGKLRNDR